MSAPDTEDILKDRIKIDEEYSLKPDPRCWILLYYRKKPKKDGTGETYDYDPTYHATVGQALQAYIDKKAGKAKKDVLDLKKQIDGAMKHIDELCLNRPSLFKSAP